MLPTPLHDEAARHARAMRWADEFAPRRRIARIIAKGGPRPRISVTTYGSGATDVHALSGLDNLEADRFEAVSLASGRNQALTRQWLDEVPTAAEAVAVASVVGFAAGLASVAAPALRVAA